jgi:hypothetical protein
MKTIKLTKIRIIALSAVVVAAGTISALAIPTTTPVPPGTPAYVDGVVVQNNTAKAPIIEFQRSGTTSVNKGRLIFTFNNYTGTASGYPEWFRRAAGCVTNSSGVAVPIRVQLGSNASTIIEPGGCFDIALNRGYTSVTVTPFSNTSTAGPTAYYWSHQRE